MAIVLDANIVAALALPLPYSEQATEKVAVWKTSGESLIAPQLFEYEVVSILRKAISSQLISEKEALASIERFAILNIQAIAPTPELHQRSLVWAKRLNQYVAYDAQYLAVADWAKAEMWTADRRLTVAAHNCGAAWVHWVGDSSV